MSRLLPKWVIEELNRYSFIYKSYAKGSHLFLEYIIENDIKIKKIARRCNLEKLQGILAKIRIEVGEKNNDGYRGNYYII